MVRNICTRYYIPRFPTLFGARRNKSLGFVDKVIAKIIKGEELKIADDKIDSPTYSIDAADALISILEQKRPFGVYHVANTGRTSYYEFVIRVAELLKVDAKVGRAKSSDFDGMAPNALKTAMRSVKLDPLRHWKESLDEYIAKGMKR